MAIHKTFLYNITTPLTCSLRASVLQYSFVARNFKNRYFKNNTKLFSLGSRLKRYLTFQLKLGFSADFSAKKVPLQRPYFLLEFGLWKVCSPGEHIPDIFTFSVSIPASLYLQGDKIVHAENMYYSCNAHANFWRINRQVDYTNGETSRVSTEFRRQEIPYCFVLPYLPYFVQNCLKFHGISRNSVLNNYKKNAAEFRILLEKFRIPPEVKKPLPFTP